MRMTGKIVLAEGRGAPARMAVLLALLTGGVAANMAHAADTNKGGQLYASHCISCHGGPNTSAAPGSPSFERGQNLLRPDVMLMQVTRVGRNAMPAYQGLLTNRDIMDIIAYMRTLH